MSIVDHFQKGKFSDFRKETKESLNQYRDSRLGEMRQEMAKPLIVILNKLNEDTYRVFRTDSDGVVSVGDCFDMGRFKDAETAELALKQMKDSVRRNERLYTAGQYFYHILPDRDARLLAQNPKEDEEEDTEIDLGDREDDSPYGDGGMDGIGEATDIYKQIVSISKGKNGNLTFADGDVSSLTTESAKKILSSLDGNKDKSIPGLSKSYESFMKTLNTIVTESYVVDISRKKK